jgi:REP element-mobilizing transposase RayT
LCGGQAAPEQYSMSNWKILPGAEYYFITTTIVDWQIVFTTDLYHRIILNSMEHCIKNKGLHLHAYVIMPNHAHYILSTGVGKSLSDIMRDFNTRTSREITSLLKREGKDNLQRIFRNAARLDGRGNSFKVWQEGFHPIALLTEPFLLQKLNYLHDNPVRKGYVERPEEWKYSSARNYFLDDHTVIKVETLL